MAKRRGRFRLVRRVGGLALLALLIGGAWLVQYVRGGIFPTTLTNGSKYVRFEHATTLANALAELQAKGIVRDARAMRWYAIWRRAPANVGAGTYALEAGMKADDILDTLHRPIKRMVRIPETNWSNRTARLLEQKGVLKASEYMELVHDPQAFKNDVDFPLPAKSLEGYLWPDTYDLPPLVGPRSVILRQLKAFERKVWIPLGQPKNLDRILTVASLVELEVARDEERPIVAAIIENRLKKKMPLQIDATILYAQDKWHEPTLKDIRKTDSPYNTYKHKGLPPTPVCSPSWKSIEAAANPAKVNYLYYVALPNGRSLFGATMKDHEANIAVRKMALAVAKLSGGLR